MAKAKRTKGTELLLLIGFALPPILQLARTPAIRVLRRDIGPPPLASLLAYGPAALVLVLLVQWVTADVSLSHTCELLVLTGTMVGQAVRVERLVQSDRQRLQHGRTGNQPTRATGNLCRITPAMGGHAGGERCVRRPARGDRGERG